MTTTFYINEGKTEKFRIILHNYIFVNQIS